MKRIICTVINDLTYDQRMIRICTTLAEAGYSVQLIGRRLPKSLPLQTRVFQQKRLSCFFRKGKFFYLEYNIRLFFFLLFSKYDIICSIDLDTILPGFWVAKFRQKICVYDAHEYFTETPEVVHRPMTKRIWETVARNTIPKMDYCYTVSEGFAERMTALYSSPFEVIRNVPFAALDSPNREGRKDKEKILLYQGALNEGRGIEALLKAMCGVEGAQLWLAGEGDLSEELRRLAQTLEVEDKVVFLGYVVPEKLKALTLEADIGLNLLENRGLSYYYSLANKCFDYIQAELPSIQMAFPEYQKINTEYEVSILIPDLEVETIEYAIQKLLSDAAFYQQLQANCRVAKEWYTWEREAMKLKAFYSQL